MNTHATEALILAAGKGSRVGELPFQKSLLPSKGGKPILSYALKSLFNSGFNHSNTTVMVGHKRESVEAYIGSNTKIAIQHVLNGTGGALETFLKNLPAYTSRLVVLNGDDSLSYYAHTVQSLLHSHSTAGADITLSVTDKYNPNVHKMSYIPKYDSEFVSIEDAKKEKGYYLTGLCILEVAYIKEKIAQLLEKHDTTKEFGITDLYRSALSDGRSIRTILNPQAALGINTLEDWHKSIA
ncbi:MAG: NTP transferase domain-containing protein [Candidatus Gracilibacteria bacterium]